MAQTDDKQVGTRSAIRQVVSNSRRGNLEIELKRGNKSH